MSKHREKFTQPLTGRFLGWGDDCNPHRYIKIATVSGDKVAKVAKSLRPSIQDWEPGIWLTMLAKKQVNLTTGETSIKVKYLLTPPSMSGTRTLVDNPTPMQVAEPIEPIQIRVCQGSSCRRRGSEGICRTMQAYIDRHDLTDRVELKPVKCLHQCKAAPHAIITHPVGGSQPQKTHYRQLQHYQIKAILTQHLPIESPANPIGYNLVRKISNYLQRQIASPSTAL